MIRATRSHTQSRATGNNKSKGGETLKTGGAVEAGNEIAPIQYIGEKRGLFYYLRRDWQLYALLLIPLSFVLLFKYAPMSGLMLAFKEYKI
jgi:putative aldouronate transport system permease protein